MAASASSSSATPKSEKKGSGSAVTSTPAQPAKRSAAAFDTPLPLSASSRGRGKRRSSAHLLRQIWDLLSGATGSASAYASVSKRQLQELAKTMKHARSGDLDDVVGAMLSIDEAAEDAGAVNFTEFEQFFKILLHSAFKKLDADGNGVINGTAELSGLVSRLYSVKATEQRAKQLLAAIDSDGSATIDEEEFSSFILAMFLDGDSTGNGSGGSDSKSGSGAVATCLTFPEQVRNLIKFTAKEPAWAAYREKSAVAARNAQWDAEMRAAEKEAAEEKAKKEAEEAETSAFRLKIGLSVVGVVAAGALAYLWFSNTSGGASKPKPK